MNIYVGRLSRNITDIKLQELFEQYGPVTSIKIIKDKFTGSPKGFAFIEMPTESAHEAISALNGAEFDGQKIIVSEARPRDTNGGNGGGFRSRESRPYSGGGNRSRFNNNRY